MNLHEKIYLLRKERGETQTQTANGAGITLRQWQRFESGEQKPGFDVLISIVDHFEVLLDYSTGRSDRREIDGKLVGEKVEKHDRILQTYACTAQRAR